MSAEDEYPKSLTSIPYSSDSSLNTLDIHIPRPPPPEPSKDQLWIIYIHGGAWRDPTIDSTSFSATQQKLAASSISPSITAYASLNYRLSPYPSHPTHPSNPSDPARNAKHPDHIADVLSALLYLQESYHFGDRYVLVGHSVGATLALQVAMKRYWGSQYESTFALELNVVPPVAIVGLEGIYDLPGLVARHADQPVYRDFVTNAMASADWASASPVNADFEESWPDGSVVVLGHSREDGLVEWEQVEGMREMLKGQGFGEGGERRVEVVELRGQHDEVWESGEGAKAVELAVREVMGQ